MLHIAILVSAAAVASRLLSLEKRTHCTPLLWHANEANNLGFLQATMRTLPSQHPAATIWKWSTLRGIMTHAEKSLQPPRGSRRGRWDDR